jgi:hypothetical protein
MTDIPVEGNIPNEAGKESKHDKPKKKNIFTKHLPNFGRDKKEDKEVNLYRAHQRRFFKILEILLMNYCQASYIFTKLLMGTNTDNHYQLGTR